VRWFNFGILVLVALVLQGGFCRLFGLGPQRIAPDILLMLAVVIAFRGPIEQGPIACWILGLAKDASSEAVLGSYALAFGLTGVLVLWLRELLYGDHFLGLMGMTLLSSFLAEHFVFAISLVRGDLRGDNYGALAAAMLFSALLTAALAPYGQWLVLKLHRQLGLPGRRVYGRRTYKSG